MAECAEHLRLRRPVPPPPPAPAQRVEPVLVVELEFAGIAVAACIGCGACVAACKNASAMRFVGAKAAQLNLLPQGKPEQDKRVLTIVRQMDAEGFGGCTNQYECDAVCPKEISTDVMAKLNRDYTAAALKVAVC